MGTHEWRQMLPAAHVAAVYARRLSVLEDEADLNDSRDASQHESITKEGVNHGADHTPLRLCAHGGACKGNNDRPN